MAVNGSKKMTIFMSDGLGFVERLETFGDDLTVVNAARVSFAKESTEFDNKDAKLVKYLAKHGHISPFFHPQIRFRLKMPIFVAVSGSATRSVSVVMGSAGVMWIRALSAGFPWMVCAHVMPI